jgi:hypothetical protein
LKKVFFQKMLFSAISKQTPGFPADLVYGVTLGVIIAQAPYTPTTCLVLPP